uniref:Uncharacterized protein n=1 Tax=Meloidogyne enterolobii TaxID=390850 RepID=A0A6V7XIV2_MELEN|nr:unnamed protein product [Meloidogyne enterolobii]
MNIIQKLMYLRGLYKYYSANFLQKQLIDKQIINQLSIESRLFIKQTNDQKISSLSEKIQSSINLLQNPTDCFTAKIFVCPVSKLGNLYKNIFFLFRRKKAVLVGDLVFCCIGFGKFLIFNFIKLLFNSFCFIFAFKSGRTVVFTNETIRVVNNQYDVKWNELFKTASKCSYTEHVKLSKILQNFCDKTISILAYK